MDAAQIVVGVLLAVLMLFVGLSMRHVSSSIRELREAIRELNKVIESVRTSVGKHGERIAKLEALAERPP